MCWSLAGTPYTEASFGRVRDMEGATSKKYSALALLSFVTSIVLCKGGFMGKEVIEIQKH